VNGELSSVGRRVEGLAAGNAGRPGLWSWCLHPGPTDDCWPFTKRIVQAFRPAVCFGRYELEL